MLVLYLILVLCTLAVLGSTLAFYFRVRRQMRRSDERLRVALAELEEERRVRKI